jgi:hypothetical protein
LPAPKGIRLLGLTLSSLCEPEAAPGAPIVLELPL